MDLKKKKLKNRRNIAVKQFRNKVFLSGTFRYFYNALDTFAPKIKVLA